MPVNQPTHEHEHWEAKATKDRMFLAGEESVKNAGEYFLRRLSGQTNNEYQAMLDRSLFFNAARRTHSALLGLVHRKPVEVKVPEGGEDFIHSMDLSMNGHFDQFAKQVTDEVLQVGRVGVAIDYDDISARPYACMYKGEDIISVQYADRHSVSDYSRIVLQEYEKIFSDDEFEERYTKIYRVKKLTEIGMVEEIYRSKDEKSYFLDETIVPTKNGQPLDRIPFVIFGTNGCYAEYQESLLHDIISVNIQHYILCRS